MIKEIDLNGLVPRIVDPHGNKFLIDFEGDRKNYFKKKSTIKKEIIGRALGAGRLGIKVLDLSAGLAIDAVFLSQLGFEVTAVERNPLIFLALQHAQAASENKLQINFQFGRAQDFLVSSSETFDLIYFDPMFPEKIKSALPRQEMVFFRSLVGQDSDADQVLQLALRKPNVKRVVVKRPIKAPILFRKPMSQIEGKLIRFYIYLGVG